MRIQHTHSQFPCQPQANNGQLLVHVAHVIQKRNSSPLLGKKFQKNSFRILLNFLGPESSETENCPRKKALVDRDWIKVILLSLNLKGITKELSNVVLELANDKSCKQLAVTSDVTAYFLLQLI